MKQIRSTASATRHQSSTDNAVRMYQLRDNLVVLGAGCEASGVELSKAQKKYFNITYGIYSCMVEPEYYFVLSTVRIDDSREYD